MNEENKPSEVSEPTTTPEPEKTEPQAAESAETPEMAGPEPMDEEVKPQPVEEPKKPLPVFRLKLKAKVLEATFTAIVSIVEEATFTVSALGVNLKALDSSHIAMVVFNYPKEAFEEFSVDREGKIAFDLTNALKVLRRAEKEDIAELVMSDQEKLLPLDLWIHGKYERVFNLPVLAPYEEEPPEPKVSFETSIKMSVQGLNNAVEDATLVSDHVKVIAQPEILQLKAEGDSTTADIKFVKGLSEHLLSLEKLDIAKLTTATYSLKYLQEIAKGIRDLADVVVLNYSTDMPLQIQAEAKGTMTYYLAPRVEEEQ